MLLSVLFCLSSHITSEIFIDSSSTADVWLTHSRNKLEIAPQDRTMFGCTLRYNLDPFEDFSDTKLARALEQAQLKSWFENLTGGLSH